MLIKTQTATKEGDAFAKSGGGLKEASLAGAGTLLHELFERQAEQTPDNVAVLFGEQATTYKSLETLANQFAWRLRESGVGPDSRVAIQLPRSLAVYAAMLGILKAGAAYVPLDPDCPAERVAFILSDSQAIALITTTELAGKFPQVPCDLICIDGEEEKISSWPGHRLDRCTSRINPDDLCYIIYTSGSTGRPKGVQIEHRNACHLVRAEKEIFHATARDRVYQGFSVAFDASVEEMWLAFSSGATLVAATDEMHCAGAGLSRLLTQKGVTILSCVPTLLSMLENDIPTLRLLILGGEECSGELVRRWARPGLRIFNTYGPTEATVIATYGECDPDKPVTIGKAVPGYEIYILNEQLRPAQGSECGEICIGGAGVARGYTGRPDLTAEKFIPNPFGEGRLYRTGDLGCWTQTGEIAFRGRIDGQVKLRGFRIELSEIEAVLRECPGVKAAAATVREDIPGLQQLVAYVVLNNPDARATLTACRRRLRTRLPAFMVPATLETLPQLPLLPSGKVDRKNLPAPRGNAAEPRNDLTPPRTELEREIAATWERLFASAQVSARDDFFLDLGGHSLLAARMVSELRKSPRFQELSMLDVYRNPTIESLAGEIEKRPSKKAGPPRTEDFQRVPFWRHFWCGTAQLVSLFFVLTFFALQWLAPYLTYTVLIEEQYDFPQAILGAFASLIILYPIMLVIPIVVKWIVIGRYRPGSYPLWGFFYFRFWLATTIEASVPVSYLAGTPLLGIYLRLMGAKIGRNAHLNTDSFAIYDLLSIGDDSSLNADSKLLGYTVENGQLKIGSVTIGKGCFVGARCAVREDTVMEDNSSLEDLSLLPRGAVIPQGETWIGSPARAIMTDDSPSEDERHASRPSSGRRFVFGVLHAIGLLIFPVLVTSALFPGIVVMNKLNYLDPYYWYLLLSPLVGLSFVVLLALEIAGLKWLLLGRVKPGCHSAHSLYYLRKWFVDQTLTLSLDVLGPLYASVYLTPWYKLLGAKMGRGAEVSTASFISPDLLSIGDESFIADSVSLGAPRVRNGFITVGRNHIGARSFIGNSALLPPGTTIGDNVLIGCLSVPPRNPADALREDAAWVGSPSLFLPQRQQSAKFSEQTTFNPTVKLRVQRATIEFIRVVTPSTCFIILLSLLFSGILLLRDYLSLGQTLLCFPFLYIGCGVAAVVFTILMKWILVWRYRAGEHPLWSTFVWRNELLNALHEHLAEPFLVGSLTGTPFVCWYFRLLGARIGRRVYLETTDFSEFDLASIGDEASLNADCTVQSHLFEDRVMKMSTVDIAPRCSIGAGSLVLYDTRMEAGVGLGDLSLLMKGEVLPPGTRWEGVPARPMKNPADSGSEP